MSELCSFLLHVENCWLPFLYRWLGFYSHKLSTLPYFPIFHHVHDLPTVSTVCCCPASLGSCSCFPDHPVLQVPKSVLRAFLHLHTLPWWSHLIPWLKYLYAKYNCFNCSPGLYLSTSMSSCLPEGDLMATWCPWRISNNCIKLSKCKMELLTFPWTHTAPTNLLFPASLSFHQQNLSTLSSQLLSATFSLYHHLLPDYSTYLQIDLPLSLSSFSIQ